jgi:hypothetical protein
MSTTSVSNSVSSENYFDCLTVATMARVKEEFILECEHEQLLTIFTMPDGRKGLCSEEIVKLKVIRHLHYDIGLDLEAVDFVLRYRDQIKMLKQKIAERERQLRQKEQEYLDELRNLRQRLAE